MTIADAMAAIDIPTVKGSVIIIMSLMASGYTPAIGTFMTDQTITVRNRTAHMETVVKTVFRTKDFNIAAPANFYDLGHVPKPPGL